MSRGSEWSGLAPAVDAHLSRWARANRNIGLARAICEPHGQTIENLDAFDATDWGMEWSLFGASFGLPGKDGKPITTGFFTDGETISGREQFRAEGVAVWQGARLAVEEHQMLSLGVSHYISGEVMDEVTEAAEIANNEPIYDTDIFTPHGFAVFEKPLVVPDLDPDSGLVSDVIKVHIRAMGWTTSKIVSNDPAYPGFHDGVLLFFYTTAQDYAEGYFETYQDAKGEEPPIAPSDFRNGFAITEVAPWMLGKAWATRADGENFHTNSTVPGPVASERRFFYTLMRLMFQQIVVRSAEDSRVKRQNRRQWERARKPVLDYTVLRLRRVVDPNYKPQGGGEALTYRQWRRGHWKFQFLPGTGLPARDEQGRQIPESHRWQWIEGYFAGPEDGPIGPLHSATSVVR